MENKIYFYCAVVFILIVCWTCFFKRSRHSGGWSEASKENHIITFILNDSIFLEKHKIYESKHATTTDSYSYYITDSIHFRKYVGTKFDEGSEKMRWIINDSNEVMFYLVSENFPVGAMDTMIFIEKTEKDPEKIIEKRRSIMKFVYDTTKIGHYNIQDLIKEGKLE